MQLLTTVTLTLLAGFVCTSPIASEENDKLIITKDHFPDSFAVYKGEHEIVNIIVPLNKLNYDTSYEKDYLYFFVEADDDESGKRVYKGLYVVKDGVSKKLLDNGRDAAAANDDSEDVFLAAADGIYRYNDKKVSAEKYGSIKESIIGIEKASGSDLIYILTEDKKVYKVTKGGGKKEKIKEIVGAEQILLDYENNLYYLDGDNQIYVYNKDGVKKIEGIPKDSENVRLLKPVLTSRGTIPFVVDDSLYVIDENEGVEHFDAIEFGPDATPSAYALEAGEVQFYALDKKIYKLELEDIGLLLIEAVFEEFKKKILKI